MIEKSSTPILDFERLSESREDVLLKSLSWLAENFFPGGGGADEKGKSLELESLLLLGSSPKGFPAPTSAVPREKILIDLLGTMTNLS